MNNDNGRASFGIELETSQLKADVAKVKQTFAGLGNKAEAEGTRIDNTFKKVGAGIATYFGTQQLLSFARDVATVRGEMQQLEVAFNTMLKSKSKTNALLSEVVETAASTPYALQDVGKGAKQLLAFQVPAEEVLGTIRQIGDLSAGIGAPLNDMISIYGKVKAKGKLQAEEMNLFLERGIPLVSKLAEQYKTTEGAVYDMASKGKIGFSDLQSVIQGLTSEGGMFYNMMAEQSKTITGQISNLGDAWDQMLNEIGSANEGVISDTIQLGKTLVENYGVVTDVLKALIATYGAYKAATIFNSLMMQAEAAGSLAKALRSTAIAQSLLNTAQAANPVGLVLAGITALAGAYLVYNNRRKESLSIQGEINREVSSEVVKLDGVFSKLKQVNEGSEERGDLIKIVNERYGDYLENLLTEKSTLADIEQAQTNATNALISSIGVKATKQKLEVEISDISSNFDKEFGEVLNKFGEEFGADRIPEFVRSLYAGIDQEIANQGGNIERGVLESSNVAKGIYDKYISEISQKTGYLEYDFNSFKKSFLNFAETKAKKNGIVETLNGIVEAYEGMYKVKKKSTEEDPAALTVDDKVSKEIVKNQEFLTNAQKEMQFSIDQARIDAMKEGIEKTLEQNYLDFQAELSQLEEHKKEVIEKAQELQKAKFLASGGKAADFEFNIGEVDLSGFSKLEEALTTLYFEANKEAYQTEKEKNEKLLQEYESYQQARTRIDEDYAAKKKELEEAGGNSANLAILEEEHQKQVELIDKNFASKEASFVAWSNQITKLGLAQLKSALETASATLDTTGGDLTENEVAILRAKIAELTKRIAIVQAENDAESDPKQKDWTKTLKILNEVDESVRNVVDGFKGLNPATQSALNAATNITGSVISMIVGIQAVAIAGAEAIKGVERASVILSIIGAAISLITTIVSLLKKSTAEMDNQKILEEITQKKIAQQREFNLLILEQNRLFAEAESIFGANEIAKATRSIEVYRNAISLSKKEMEGLGKINVKVGSHTEGWWLWKKQVDEMESITEVYPDLITAEGELNAIRAESILQSEDLSDVDRERIQHIVELQEQAVKAEEALSSYLEKTFGSLGTDAVESLVSAIRDGKDAWEEFGEAGSKVLENLGKQLAYELFLSTYFDKLKTDVEKIYGNTTLTEEQIGEMVVTRMGSFFGEMGPVLDDAENFMKNFQDLGAKHGFSLWSQDSQDSPDARTATQKGFTSMSQDTGNEMNGRITNIQGHTYLIVESMKIMARNMATMLVHVANIEYNTDNLQPMREDMSEMKKNMSSLKAGMDVINHHGIKLRNS